MKHDAKIQKIANTYSFLMDFFTKKLRIMKIKAPLSSLSSVSKNTADLPMPG